MVEARVTGALSEGLNWPPITDKYACTPPVHVKNLPCTEANLYSEIFKPREWEEARRALRRRLDKPPEGNSVAQQQWIKAVYREVSRALSATNINPALYSYDEDWNTAVGLSSLPNNPAVGLGPRRVRAYKAGLIDRAVAAGAPTRTIKGGHVVSAPSGYEPAGIRGVFAKGSDRGGIPHDVYEQVEPRVRIAAASPRWNTPDVRVFYDTEQGACRDHVITPIGKRCASRHPRKHFFYLSHGAEVEVAKRWAEWVLSRGYIEHIYKGFEAWGRQLNWFCTNFEGGDCEEALGISLEEVRKIQVRALEAARNENIGVWGSLFDSLGGLIGGVVGDVVKVIGKILVLGITALPVAVGSIACPYPPFRRTFASDCLEADFSDSDRTAEELQAEIGKAATVVSSDLMARGHGEAPPPPPPPSPEPYKLKPRHFILAGLGLAVGYAGMRTFLGESVVPKNVRRSARSATKPVRQGARKATRSVKKGARTATRKVKGAF